MKTWEFGNYKVVLLQTNLCKSLIVIDEYENLCGWLDFDGFFLGKDSKMLVSGVYVLESHRNQGVLQMLTDVLEEIYLQHYNNYSIQVDMMNPKIKSFIKRLQRTSRFNNAKWILDESKVNRPNAMLGALFIFNMMTDQKKQLITNVGVI